MSTSCEEAGALCFMYGNDAFHYVEKGLDMNVGVAVLRIEDGGLSDAIAVIFTKDSHDFLEVCTGEFLTPAEIQIISKKYDGIVIVPTGAFREWTTVLTKATPPKNATPSA